jgi:hypothetical protein
MACVINASVTSTGLVQSADATGVLNLQTNGSNALTVNANANVTVNNSLFVSGNSVQPLVSDTAKASTSGTTVEFTGIPSWVKRITVMFSGVSTSGTSNQLIQLGTGGTPTYTTSGYLGSVTTSTGATITAFSTGFMYNAPVAATTVVHGIALLTNITGNTWCLSSTLGLSDSTNTRLAGGSVALAAALTALRITTVNGTDTFDAGTINIMYE